MTKPKKLTLFALCSLALLACALILQITFAIPDYLAPLRDRYETTLNDVDPNKPIDVTAAKKLAEVYFLEFISACGGPEEPKLVDGIWVIPYREGIAGRLSDDAIRINARSAEISSMAGPHYAGYRSFRWSVLLGFGWRRFSR